MQLYAKFKLDKKKVFSITTVFPGRGLLSNN